MARAELGLCEPRRRHASFRVSVAAARRAPAAFRRRTGRRSLISPAGETASPGRRGSPEGGAGSRESQRPDTAARSASARSPRSRRGPRAPGSRPSGYARNRAPGPGLRGAETSTR